MMRTRPFPLLLRLTVCALVWLATAVSARDTALPAPVERALKHARLPAASVSLLVSEAGHRGAPLLSLHPDQARNPASVMKLVTTLASLELLGPSWQWKTPVYVQGQIRNGTLHGNLYLAGRGDPKLVIEYLWLLLRRIQSLGIRHIEGDIVLDRGAFEVPPHDPAEFDGARYRPYNAGVDALLLNFKSVLMTFVPDTTAGIARVHYEPPLASVATQPAVPLSDGGCAGYRQRLQIDIDDPQRIAFAGSYPSSCGEKTWPLAFADPASYGVRALEGLWREMGGGLSGKVREGTVPAGLAPAFEYGSPPLAEIVRTINKYSNNVMTEQLFLTLSLQRSGRGTFAESRAIVQEWWQQRFGRQDAPELSTGSGRSRSDRMTARALERLLQYAWSSPLMPELLSSLPITGQDGTLKPERWHAAGTAHLKTGSLRDVNAVAGIVHGRNGKRYVLVAIVNHPQAAAARPVFEALVDWVATRP